MASLLTQLRVVAVGGGRFGNQDVILIDSEADIDRAIAKLAELGIAAERG